MLVVWRRVTGAVGLGGCVFGPCLVLSLSALFHLSEGQVLADEADEVGETERNEKVGGEVGTTFKTYSVSNDLSGRVCINLCGRSCGAQLVQTRSGTSTVCVGGMKWERFIAL